LAAALGFHKGGEILSPAVSAISAFGGAYGFSVTQFSFTKKGSNLVYPSGS
jgi:hypothetical protein